jgi:hypothetical protein
MHQQDNFVDFPVGTSVRQDRDGCYWVLPKGTTRRQSVIVAWDGLSVVQTDLSKDACVRVSVFKSQLT